MQSKNPFHTDQSTARREVLEVFSPCLCVSVVNDLSAGLCPRVPQTPHGRYNELAAKPLPESSNKGWLES